MKQKIIYLYQPASNSQDTGASIRLQLNQKFLADHFSIDYLPIKNRRDFPHVFSYIGYLFGIKEKIPYQSIVFMEFPKLILCVPRHAQIFYSAHNFETSLHWNVLLKEQSIRSCIDLLRWSLLEYWTLLRAKKVVAISKTLEKQLPSIARNKVITLLPLPKKAPSAISAKITGAKAYEYICIGSFGWLPNKDAFDWFATTVAPIVSMRSSRHRVFRFVGSGNQLESDVNIGNVSIQCVDYVHDLEATVQKHRAIIIPIGYGSGIKIKLINAIQYEFPTITTAKGAEGLEEYFNYLKPCSTSESFAKAIIDLDEIQNIASSIQRIRAVKKCLYQDSKQQRETLAEQMHEAMNKRLTGRHR